jgi:hypothetical protein
MQREQDEIKLYCLISAGTYIEVQLGVGQSKAEREKNFKIDSLLLSVNLIAVY